MEKEIPNFYLVVEAPGLFPHLKKTSIGSKVISQKKWDSIQVKDDFPVYFLFAKPNATTDLSPDDLATVLEELLSPNDSDMIFLDNMNAIARVRRLHGQNKSRTSVKPRIVRPPPFYTKALDRSKEVIPQRPRDDDNTSNVSTGVAVAVGVLGVGIALAVVSMGASSGLSGNNNEEER